MMGQRQFTSKLYYQLSLDGLVPQDHLLRRIAQVIDFSFIYPLAKPYYSHTGQPSVDPVVIFKTLLLGYLYGITSERRLMRETQVNLAYRWFLGYDLDEAIFDHSVLSKARARFGMEVFEGFFERSIEMCREAGLLAEGPVYVDTTLVQAAASMDSLVERVRPPLSISEYIQRLNTDNDSAPQQWGPAPPSSPELPTAPDPRIPPRYRKGRPKGHRSKINNELVSRTDPEATIVSRRGFGLHLAYKAHVAVSGNRGQVITAAVATTGAKADEHVLGEVLWHHRRLSKLPIGDIVADAKYGTMANYSYLNQAGLSAFIPPRKPKGGPRDLWSKERFRYLAEEDVYLCPAGKRMRRFARRASTRRMSYRAEKGACMVCSFRSQCTSSRHERIISRFWDQHLVEEASARVGSSLGRKLLKERKVRVEGVFALAKELHGLRRTRLRGRRKVQIQLWLAAAAMNLKRAVRRLNRMAPTEMAAQMTIARVHSQVFTCLTAIGRLITTTGHLFSHPPEFLFSNSPCRSSTTGARAGTGHAMQR